MACKMLQVPNKGIGSRGSCSTCTGDMCVSIGSLWTLDALQVVVATVRQTNDEASFWSWEMEIRGRRKSPRLI